MVTLIIIIIKSFINEIFVTLVCSSFKVAQHAVLSTFPYPFPIHFKFDTYISFPIYFNLYQFFFSVNQTIPRASYPERIKTFSTTMCPMSFTWQFDTGENISKWNATGKSFQMSQPWTSIRLCKHSLLGLRESLIYYI